MCHIDPATALIRLAPWLLLPVWACGGTAAPVATPRPAAPALAPPAAAAPVKPPLVYPAARRGDTVDQLHGVAVADPYRWLEDPDSAETRAWIEAENKVTQAWLAAIPARERIERRLTRLWNYERFSAPKQVAGRYFYARNDGLQNQAVLWVSEGLTGTPRVLLDPNTLSADGTTALKRTEVSHDGKLLAYQVSKAGSDWVEVKVREVDTGADRPDHLRWVKFSGIAWRHDGSGFYYSRYDAPDEKQQLRAVNYFQKLFFHRLGTEQSADQLIYERKDHKDWGFGAVVSEDERWLIIPVWRGAESKNQIFVQDLRPGKGRKASKTVELITGFAHEFDFVGNDGSKLWFKTDQGAQRGRVVEIDVRKPKGSKELVAESAETLRAVSLVGDRLMCSYLKDARSEVRVHHLDGKLDKVLPLPGIGSAWGFSGKRADRETFFIFTGFTWPTTVYRYDFDSGEASVFKRPKVDFKPDDYETRQVFFTSKDGTRVPMFLVHRKGLKLDGSHRVYMHAYGGFNIALTPSFRVDRHAWVEGGGVYAMPNLRGGGEYGEAWHKAGMKGKKQNVFDDFIAAAQWLVSNKYTTPERLAIGGGSNGGLLVGACMVQRPELFGAVLAAVGVMDMLRFHKWTIGWAWVPEYGTADKAEDFQWLRAYSPYHNLKPARYPATLVSTADHDDRVVPAHSFKFAAALQHNQKGEAPTLIRIETKAGHGAGKPTSKKIAEAADLQAFLLDALAD